MLQWLVGGYVIFTAVLIGAACFVALFANDKLRREHGLNVLRLLWVSSTTSGGIVLLAAKIQELNVI